MKLLIALTLTIIFMSAFACCNEANADTATITFTPPTEREDNTPLSPDEIAGYEVYNTDGVSVKSLPGDATSFTMGTTSAMQSLVVTTKDTDGRESVYSQIVNVPASVSNPKPPTGFSIVVVP